ncbi:NUDIX domain-containing protein, partial [Streptomyces atratus]|uniref:NUDIX domain-containing protein n=1 Tax=Streptomyces atratus TaxID=1893 RepID=UPI0036A9FD18
TASSTSSARSTRPWSSCCPRSWARAPTPSDLTALRLNKRGRILVHRRSEQVSRFPGLYEVEVGGAANVGESYEQAATRELAEELGIRALPRLLFTFINRSGLSPHWLGVHEAVVPDAVVPDPDEVAWHGWLTEPELRSALLEWRFTLDSHEAFSRYLAFRTARS